MTDKLINVGIANVDKGNDKCTMKRKTEKKMMKRVEKRLISAGDNMEATEQPLLAGGGGA